MRTAKTIVMKNGKITDRDLPLKDGQLVFDDVSKKTLTYFGNALYDNTGTVVADVPNGGRK